MQTDPKEWEGRQHHTTSNSITLKPYGYSGPISFAGKFEIFVHSDNERGVRSKAVFTPGEFVMEYEANLLDEQQQKLAESEYEEEGEKPILLKLPKGFLMLHIG